MVIGGGLWKFRRIKPCVSCRSGHDSDTVQLDVMVRSVVRGLVVGLNDQYHLGGNEPLTSRMVKTVSKSSIHETNMDTTHRHVVCHYAIEYNEHHDFGHDTGRIDGDVWLVNIVRIDRHVLAYAGANSCYTVAHGPSSQVDLFQSITDHRYDSTRGISNSDSPSWTVVEWMGCVVDTLQYRLHHRHLTGHG